VTPSDLCNDLGDEKLEWWSYQTVKEISMICSAILIQSTRVTDGQTDRQTE